ncbi:hypothetical protein ACQJZ4_07595 [Bacillus altitudinis]|uniref:hypothetical protein n=1 Tax=Bacillus altitudinis TaxID=293387 RepID=UPI003CF83649
MDKLKRLIALNKELIALEELTDTGSQRIAVDEDIRSVEKELKNSLGEESFDRVIDAVVEMMEGKRDENYVLGVYKNEVADTTI